MFIQVRCFYVEGDCSMNGILPLWKPKGMTSHDCVMKIRTLFGTKKVGHTGTLDPEVEGVLGICIGEGTKLVPYLTKGSKTYLAEVTLGSATETEDAHGEVVDEQPVTRLISKKEIEDTLQQFIGEIKQIPPMYSAIRVDGKRLYEYARANEYVERPERIVHISSLVMQGEYDDVNRRFAMEVTCSQGTYIRTLCVDIGKKLGYPAYMSSLVRTETSSFTKNDAITFSELTSAKENGELQKYVHPLLRGIGDMEQVEVDASTQKKVYHGNKLPIPPTIQTFPFAYVREGQLLAIYDKHPTEHDVSKPVRVFNF